MRTAGRAHSPARGRDNQFKPLWAGSSWRQDEKPTQWQMVPPRAIEMVGMEASVDTRGGGAPAARVDGGMVYTISSGSSALLEALWRVAPLACMDWG